MDINLLKKMAIFTNLVETGSFKATAQKLDMAPSVVSKSISDLERALGVELLHRSTRSLRLSQAGERFIQSCTEMLDTAESGVATISGRTNELTGKLSITVPTIMVNQRFAHFLMQFRQKFPKIILNIDVSDDTRNLFREPIDLAFRFGQPHSELLYSQSLFDAKFILCTHYHNQKLRQSIKSPSDLVDWPTILVPALGNQLTLYQEQANHSHPASTYLLDLPADQVTHINSGSLIYACLTQSQAWGLFPEFAIEAELENQRFIQLLPEWIVSTIALQAITPAKLSRQPLAKAFVDAFLDYW